MSRGQLLDANALIALVVAEHEHHRRVSTWSAGVVTIALCPITEGAMVRYLIRVGESSATVAGLLAGLHGSAKVEFWPDEVSYVDVPLEHVTGHRQVTDAYLAALAASRGAELTTFDEALAATLTESVSLIP